MLVVEDSSYYHLKHIPKHILEYNGEMLNKVDIVFAKQHFVASQSIGGTYS